MLAFPNVRLQGLSWPGAIVALLAVAAGSYPHSQWTGTHVKRRILPAVNTLLRHPQGLRSASYHRAIMQTVIALVLLVSTACASAGSNRSCGVATPWLRVVNDSRSPILVSQWDGGPSTSVSAGASLVLFPHEAAPSPPWHLTVLDPNGAVLFSSEVDAKGAVQELTIDVGVTKLRPTHPPAASGC